MKNSFAKLLGIIFIVIGVLGVFIIVGTFDFKEYNSIKDLTLTYADEIKIMKAELLNRWILAISILLFNLAVGAVLLVLDKIANTLEEIKERL